MRKRDVWTMLVLAVGAGLLGGLMSGSLTSTPPALAEKTAAPKVISAESFFIVDQQGQVRAALTLSPDNSQPALVFLDKQGKVRLRASLLAQGHPAVYVDGKDGEPFWYEP